MSKRLEIIRLGVVPYGQALALQMKLRERLKAQRDEDLVGYLIALEHPPTVTLGKRGSFEDLVNHAWLHANGVEVFKIDRGGEATFHEPGQLVVYPILRLSALGKGVVDVIRGMAACLGESVAEYGKVAAYDLEHPGLWTQDETPSRKLASVGMRVQSGVTTHGVAMNLVNQMIGFSMIVVCGMPNTPMARLCDYLDDDLDFDTFRDDFLARFGAFLEVNCVDGKLELPPPEDWVLPDQEWSKA
ncbi:lipoyl(octanoyl) transferase LipB [Bradymonas sediminis]|uniref:Octanoyltransferase n=1 Tax=Bradymonas sediminis TaxID=1548548 RepID=A0A2Z4FIJ9_9DELT|nr:lipoyl(octanoyl) transferase LipB [Bradymonas sediminis]AWV88762.1 lipoyl(octanoyl) transferase [Bradymonas sediminis]TDP63544.1 lipoyl(octanoyl) transferase [Bradymonas sediminis]